MNAISSKILDKKIIIRVRDRVCETSEELLSSELFFKFLKLTVERLARRNSILLDIFPDKQNITDQDLKLLTEAYKLLVKMPIAVIPNLLPEAKELVSNPSRLNDFDQHLYNSWRNFDRFILCDSEGDTLDKRPYRTFNTTVEQLTHLVRRTHRDVYEHVMGAHPNIYRQVPAGAGMSAICKTKELPLPDGIYEKLNKIPLVRQVMLFPPLVLDPPMNKRKGKFERVYSNPLDFVEIDETKWICYPAKVGPLIINVYFSERFFEIGLALTNLFEIAEDKDLKRKPDAVFLFGVPGDSIDHLAPFPTVFYDDKENDMLVGAIPDRDEFGYFGYVKKMVLTLHNIRMMKSGKMPYHGAMARILLKGDKAATVLIMGDSGAGKSETLEAFRILGEDVIQDTIIIADDMGSLAINEDGDVIGYGTEIGAFVRLDDLQPGYAFGQMDRTILMNPSQVNARAILPVTSVENITKGFKVDFVLYCNNFEEVDETHHVIEQFTNVDDALSVFSAGAVMSKGTTTATGLVHSYFANVFGPTQYQDVHDELSKKYFEQFMQNGLFVGQMRTRLSVHGWEQKGPEEAAKALLEKIQNL